jgi:hypothetical protein
MPGDEAGGHSSAMASLFTEGSEICVDAAVKRADAAAFYGIPVVRMYLQSHPLVDALRKQSSKPLALALAGKILQQCRRGIADYILRCNNIRLRRRRCCGCICKLNTGIFIAIRSHLTQSPRKLFTPSSSSLL